MENEEKKLETKPILKGKHGYFLKGTAPGPGRPKGSISIKEAVRRYLEDNPEDFEDFVKHFVEKNRELAWQMLEGKPPQDLKVGQNPDLPFKIIIEKPDGAGEKS